MLKIYVWKEFCTDYTPGLAVAIAETVQDAQKMIAKELSFEPHEWGPCEEHPVQPFAACVTGGG